jgi:hypothetical protein
MVTSIRPAGLSGSPAQVSELSTPCGRDRIVPLKGEPQPMDGWVRVSHQGKTITFRSGKRLESFMIQNPDAIIEGRYVAQKGGKVVFKKEASN